MKIYIFQSQYRQTLNFLYKKYYTKQKKVLMMLFFLYCDSLFYIFLVFVNLLQTYFYIDFSYFDFAYSERILKRLFAFFEAFPWVFFNSLLLSFYHSLNGSDFICILFFFYVLIIIIFGIHSYNKKKN